MAKASRKSTAGPRRRKAAQAPPSTERILVVGPGDIEVMHAAGGMSVVERARITLGDELPGRVRSGNSAAEANARALLFDLIQQHPNGPPEGKHKGDLENECTREFGVSKRAFAQIWTETIKVTGAVAYRRSGPRGPRRRSE